MKETIELLQRLAASAFYGNVDVKFEQGQIVFIKQTQSYKPCDLKSKSQRGTEYEYHNR